MEHQQVQHVKKGWYDRSYKLLLIIPLIFLALCIIYLVSFYAKNGDIFYTDVSITGGTTITVFSPANIETLSLALEEEFPDVKLQAISDIRTGAQTGFFAESSATAEKLTLALEKQLGFNLTQENSSVEFTGSALSSSFYQQLRLAVILAFIFMAIVVFIVFRTFVPSTAVIFAAFANIVMTIAVIDILGIQLSLAGIVALLMLIGYSVDTDILLTTRVLKDRTGTVNQRISGAFKTGMLMTLTAIAAVSVSLLVTYSFSEVLRQIFTVLLIGLLFDMLNTWMTNAAMLKWYTEVKKIT